MNMRHLSPAYLRDLIKVVMKRDLADARKILKNLVLSSPKMTHTFGIVMQNIFVLYCETHVCLMTQRRDVFGVCFSHSDCNWIPPFVRTLSIVACSAPDNFAIRFFEKVLSFHTDLKELDLEWLKAEHYSLEVIQKLVSITRRLIIPIDRRGLFLDFIQRCETIYFKSDVSDHDAFQPFVNKLNFDSIALELVAFDSDMPIDEYVELLTSYKSQLQHIRHFYITFDMMRDFLGVEHLFECLITHFPMIEDVRVGVHEARAIKNETARTFYDVIKSDFDYLLDTLRQIPSRIQANIYCVLQYYNNQVLKDPVSKLDHFFPSEHFLIIPDNKSRTVFYGKPSVTENVELFYQLRFLSSSFTLPDEGENP